MASILMKNGKYNGTNTCLNGMRHYGDSAMDDMEYTYCEKTSQWPDFCKAGYEVFLDMADAVPGFVDSIGQECYDKMLQSFVDNKPTFYTSFWTGDEITRRDAHMGIMVPRWVGEAMDNEVYDVYQQVINIGIRPYMAMLLSYIFGRGGTTRLRAVPGCWGDQSPFNNYVDYQDHRRALKRLAAYTEKSDLTLESGVNYLNIPLENIVSRPRKYVDLYECPPFAYTHLLALCQISGKASGVLKDTPEALSLIKRWNNQMQKAMVGLCPDYNPVLV